MSTKARIKRAFNRGKEKIPDGVINGFIALASLLVSLIGAIVSIALQFDTFRTIATALLSFLCAELIGHSILEKSRYFKAKREFFITEQINAWSSKFYEMNEYCQAILEKSHGKQDLFVLTCKKNIDNLHYLLQTAARDEKVEIESGYIVDSEAVFEALNITNEKEIELTFPIDNLEYGILHTQEDKKFFETTAGKVEDGSVKKVRVLLILGDTSFAKDERLTELFGFYDTNPGFEGKYISKADFIKACDNNMISSSQLDFGIYGPEMLFRVESYDPYKGVYTKNRDEVERYRKLFDEIWNFGAMVHDLPESNSGEKNEPMKIDQLFQKLSEK